MLIEQQAAPPAAQPRVNSHGHSAVARAHARTSRAGLDAIALVVTDGEPLGRQVPIGAAPVIIGRGVGVDMQILDPTVSRHHCVIWCAAGRCWIRDLGSTNHTRVNHRAARVTELFEGDVVVVGQTALTLAAVESQATPMLANPPESVDAIG